MPTETTPNRRTPRRRGQGDQLRAEIVHAAAAELARSGNLESLSLRGVARAVGIATTSIYLHFPSLEDLVIEVKRTLFEEFATAIRERTPSTGPPRERIRAVSHAYVDWAHERPGDYLVLFSVALTRAPEASAPAQVLLLDLHALAMEALGTAAPGAAQMVTTHLWTLMHGSLVLRLARPAMAWPDVHAQVDDAVDRLFPPAPAPRP